MLLWEVLSILRLWLVVLLNSDRSTAEQRLSKDNADGVFYSQQQRGTPDVQKQD